MHRSSTALSSLPISANLEARSERELAAYFTRSHDSGPRLAPDAAVDAAIHAIRAYHLGVLSLYHDLRVWPELVTKALGPYAALAIRLYCADHPAQGSTATLEAAAAQRLAAILAAGGPGCSTVKDLEDRAVEHHERALHAYAKARRKQDRARRAAKAQAAE